MDKAFAYWEKMYARWPQAVAELKAVNKMVDQWLLANSYSKLDMGGRYGGLVPGWVMNLIDTALPAIAATPEGQQYAGGILLVKAILDAILPLV